MLTALFILCLLKPPDHSPYFAIQVVDAQTHRGIPLIQLRTVNDIKHYTDSAGWVAFHEPGLMNREVFFHVEGPGYDFPKDGFGNCGVKLRTQPGHSATIKMNRGNVAERLYRITGQGIYRDSELLKKPMPVSQTPETPLVLGSDSVQMVPYQDKLFWLWGDTNLAHYPLGNFQTTSATTPLMGPALQPQHAIPLAYFADIKHPDQVRHMMPLQEPGVVWLFGLLTIADEQGRPALISHFTRRASLTQQYEHGLARFNDDKGIFEKLSNFDLKNTWQFPQHHAVRVTDKAGDYFYLAAPFCATRVKATWKDVTNAASYEALVYDQQTSEYRWTTQQSPTTQASEQQLLRVGKMKDSTARYLTKDADGKNILIHRASIEWNEHRHRWILIGNEQGSAGTPSLLGEVWYSEADHPTGPWLRAVKIASHPRYSFYNPRHHRVFDQDGGKTIYFEGTYTHSFSGNPSATPRYEYNQLMYKLDLDDVRLKFAH